MRRFISYTEDLLHLYDCVVIPGFGGFVAKCRDAAPDLKKSCLLPPFKEIVFDSRLTKDNGFFLDWVVRKENISEEEAVRAIELFVEDTKYCLSEGERVDFGKVGCFIPRRWGNFVFKQGNYNFHPVAWEADAVQISPRSFTGEAENLGKSFKILKYGVAVVVLAGLMFLDSGNLKDMLTERNINLTNMGDIASHSSGREMTAIVSDTYNYVEYDGLEDI